MSTKTLELIRSIDLGRVFGDNVGELVELARLNKVLLGFLRRIGFGGSLRIVEEKRYREYMGWVAEIAETLNDLDYAFYKFRKPVEHVSVDIDLLVYCKHLGEAVKRLRDRGFGVEVSEPYTVTMVKNGTIVDLYTHPSFAWIVYLDGRRLLEEVEVVEIGTTGVKAKALTPEAEAVVAAAHAIYKEHIYLLADYYVVKRWLTSKAINLGRELNAEDALRIALRLNEQIEKGYAEAPLKLTLPQTIKALVEKFVEDPNFRTTSVNALKLVPKRRAIEQLVSRFRRKTY